MPIYWEHLPVRFVVEPCMTVAVAELTEKQIKIAIDSVSKSHPGALDLVPRDGFYIGVKRMVGRVYIALDEIESALKKFRSPVVISAKDQDIWTFDLDDAFVDLFVEVAEELPERWDAWLKWRRRRRKPIPGTWTPRNQKYV